MRILKEGDNTHLRFALGALERINFVDSLDARGPTAPRELSPIVALCFIVWGRGEFSAFAPSPTGVATVVSCD
jgi:hypothetical protein